MCYRAPRRNPIKELSAFPLNFLKSKAKNNMKKGGSNGEQRVRVLKFFLTPSFLFCASTLHADGTAMRLSYPDAIRSITIKKTFTSFSALYYYHRHYTTLLYYDTRPSVRARSLAPQPPLPMPPPLRRRTAPWPLPDTKVAAAKEEEKKEGKRNRCLFKIPLGVRDRPSWRPPLPRLFLFYLLSRHAS